MNEVTFIFLLISFLVIILYELRVKSASIVLWGGLFIFFAVPHGVDVIFQLGGFPDKVYLTATLFALSFNVIYFSTRIILYDIKIYNPKWLHTPSNRKIVNHYISTLFSLLIIASIFLLVHIHITFGTFTGFTWIDLFNNRNTFYYIASSYLFSLSAPLLFIAIVRQKYNIAIITLLLFVMVLILSRVRANAISIFLPLIVFYLYAQKSYAKTLIRLFAASIFGAFFILLILFIGGLRVFGDYSAVFNFLDVWKVTLELISSPHGEFGLRNAYYYFIANDNNFEGFEQGLGYIRLLLMPVPSSLAFGLKPLDFASYMAVAYDPLNSELGVNSMHPTLYGDLFANFYFIGIFFGVFWAFIIKVLDSLFVFHRDNIFASAIFVSVVYALTLVARGAIYNGLYNVFFLLAINWLLWIIISRITKFSCRYVNSSKR
jgi:hypothetical protein